MLPTKGCQVLPPWSELVFVFVIVFVLVLCNLWPWELYSVALSGFLQYCAHRSMAFTRLSKKGLANNARLDFADMVLIEITQRSSAYLVSTQMIIFLSNNACLNFFLLWFQIWVPLLAQPWPWPCPSSSCGSDSNARLSLSRCSILHKFVFKKGHKSDFANAGIWS